MARERGSTSAEVCASLRSPSPAMNPTRTSARLNMLTAGCNGTTWASG
ncbi:Uncharacterised protein [Mycobacteroides abscessus subsp. abscessus]|nr:Uncharacterised protein [Mycobacteroides abscessus subsp. abscessus]